ncbi:GGDEF domain-containing protein, diguanylate cyclase (c-di-GMP synthetase) or its enzymatically inactive variants [Roseateles sp. YR242]|uniref:diguanylate cyclase domain-containing protein n=1 Tax=Roseateles sp. YR242 TaxID=1855305 RepID=UPI0008B1C1EB|nr:diguanylate cyclase [Roseateles sp. YR242]SEK79803.1 GGDEF domain-containing protein, diguanylate cyclase (c-di-GMP synthetase) or its enzymatically inactive variants [Roseateles sp. YR242]
MNSSSSTATAASAAGGTQEPTIARPPRHAPALTIPRVDSVGEFGLMITRQLTQCRRYGGKLAVMWLEAEPVEEAADPEGVYDAQASLMTAVGRRLRSRVRGTDAVLQVGEGSFAVLLNDAGAPEAELVRQRLHQALGGSYGVGEGMIMHVRLQIGAAAFPDGGTKGADLAQSARDDLRVRAEG